MPKLRNNLDAIYSVLDNEIEQDHVVDMFANVANAGRISEEDCTAVYRQIQEHYGNHAANVIMRGMVASN